MKDQIALLGGVYSNYLALNAALDDIDARVAKARAAGATIVQEPMDVPEVGRIAMLTQPGGGFIGWMTPS